MSRLRTLTAAVATAVIATAGVSVATAGPPTTPNTASADIQPDASYGDPVGSQHGVLDRLSGVLQRHHLLVHPGPHVADRLRAA
jgi:hypothetical protein